MIEATVTGFVTGFSLILAIGAQNAFILRHGIQRAHVFELCLFCAVSDAILIVAGVAGFGYVVTLYPALPRLMAIFGGVFLLAYGATRFWAAYKGDYTLSLTGGTVSLRTALLTVAAFTWLNPHVYLDTLALIGAISTNYPDHRVFFGFGAVTSSFFFFFSLGYGARLLAPIMQTPATWRALDFGIGIVMVLLAIKLLFY